MQLAPSCPPQQDHVSFVSSHPGRHVLDTVEVEVGSRRMAVRLFPPHCVAGTAGADFAGSLWQGGGRRRLLSSSSVAALTNLGVTSCRRSRGLLTAQHSQLLDQSLAAACATTQLTHCTQTHHCCRCCAAEWLEPATFAHVVCKGQRAELESYSAFFDQAHTNCTGEPEGFSLPMARP